MRNFQDQFPIFQYRVETRPFYPNETQGEPSGASGPQRMKNKCYVTDRRTMPNISLGWIVYYICVILKFLILHKFLFE